MINTAATLPTLQTANGHLKNWIGALSMCLLLPACASTELSQPVKAVVVKQDCPRLEIEMSLLAIRPLTPVNQIQTNGSLEDAIEIVVADHRRDRGQLIELSAAEKQREKDQAVLDTTCAQAAKERAAAIDKANELTVKVRRPFWKGLF